MSLQQKPNHWLHEWWDETSPFDPNGVWFGGSECYQVKYSMWIPNSISSDDEDALNAYIDKVWSSCEPS